MPTACTSSDPKLIMCRVDLSARINDHLVGNYAVWDVSARPNSNMVNLLKDSESKGFRVPLSGSFFCRLKYLSSNLCIDFPAQMRV